MPKSPLQSSPPDFFFLFSGTIQEAFDKILTFSYWKNCFHVFPEKINITKLPVLGASWFQFLLSVDFCVHAHYGPVGLSIFSIWINKLISFCFIWKLKTLDESRYLFLNVGPGLFFFFFWLGYKFTVLVVSVLKSGVHVNIQI